MSLTEKQNIMDETMYNLKDENAGYFRGKELRYDN